MNKYSNLHGRSFSAKIIDTEVLGRISVSPATGLTYLCQDSADGSDLTNYDRFGYKYGWAIDFDPNPKGAGGAGDPNSMEWVYDFKLLPPAEEYHRLFVKLVAGMENTWEEDTGYSVVPKALVREVVEFLGKIKNPVRPFGGNPEK